MFRRFDKVFGFTFKNQVKSGGYKTLTIVVALLLLIVPAAIFSIVAASSEDETKEIGSCGADKIYVVNELAPNADYNMLNASSDEIHKNYTNITYVNAASTEEAFAAIASAGEKTSLVLYVYTDNDGTNTKTIIPTGSSIEKDTADNLKEYLKDRNLVFTLIATDMIMADMASIGLPNEGGVYSIDGFKTGQTIYESDKEALQEHDNQSMVTGFNTILVYVTFMVVYFIVLAYGNSIMQTIVMEKSSKLMDTMLVSVSPSSMIFGKMLGVLLTGIIQFFSWILMLVLGLFAGVKLTDVIRPDNDFKVVTFLKSLGKLGLFSPVDVLIAVLVLMFGLVFYCSLSAIGGAISSTKEEAASNQSLFIILLIVSFYLVLMMGLDSETVPTWLYLFPGTSAMMLPGAVCTGAISTGIAVAGLAIMVVCTVLLLVLAGKLYTMMALYSGKKVGFADAFKMLFAGKDAKPNT